MMSHSSVTFRIVFLSCRKNRLHYNAPYTKKTSVRNETIPVTIKVKKI